MSKPIVPDGTYMVGTTDNEPFMKGRIWAVEMIGSRSQQALRQCITPSCGTNCTNAKCTDGVDLVFGWGRQHQWMVKLERAVFEQYVLEAAAVWLGDHG